MKSAILKMVMGDATISQTIAEAAIESPDELWTELEIHENVADAMGLDLDLNDTDLFGQLLNYYNGQQTIQTARSSGSFAFEVTIDDVLLAINNRSPKQITIDEATSIHGQMDMGAIEKAALYADDMDEQTEYAHQEIYKQWCRANVQHITEVKFKTNFGSCAVTNEQFEAIRGAFDVYTSPADIILNCTAFDQDEEAYQNLAAIIGKTGADNCSGRYIVFYVVFYVE